MPTTKAKKIEIIEELKKLFEKASILVFVNFHGLSVANERKLRRELKNSDIKFKVAKKSLFKRAFEAVGLKNVPPLEGEVGVAVGSGEVTDAPRIIAKLSKENEGLKMLGGVYESNFVDESFIKKLSMILSREILLTQLAFVLSQPMAGFARALNEVAKKIETK